MLLVKNILIRIPFKSIDSMNDVSLYMQKKKNSQGYDAIFGDAREIAFRSVLLPAFGNPT